MCVTKQRSGSLYNKIIPNFTGYLYIRIGTSKVTITIRVNNTMYNGELIWNIIWYLPNNRSNIT